MGLPTIGGGGPTTMDIMAQLFAQPLSVFVQNVSVGLKNINATLQAQRFVQEHDVVLRGYEARIAMAEKRVDEAARVSEDAFHEATSELDELRDEYERVHQMLADDLAAHHQRVKAKQAELDAMQAKQEKGQTDDG